MGFRTGAYAKVWEITPMSSYCTKLRVSISRKNKQTGEYDQEFSGYILAVGTAVAQKAMDIHQGATIRIGDTDVITKYNKEKKVTYIDYKMFSFETEPEQGHPVEVEPPEDFDVDEDEEGNASRLPF